jgi:CRP-like cAMP-binding protein
MHHLALSASNIRSVRDGDPIPKTVRDLRFTTGVVSNLSLFSEISADQLAEVAGHCWALSARRGDILVSGDERLAGIYVVAYGSVKLSLRGADDEERVVQLVSARETFGEAAALLGRPGRYEARALVDSLLIVIPSAAIFGLIDRAPRFARNMAKRLAEHSFYLMAEVESTCMLRGAQRLCFYLNSLAHPKGRPGSCTVRLPATKTVIASRLDMKKETLSRLLRTLVNQGLIAVARRDITLFDRERLAGFTLGGELPAKG